MRLIFAGTPEFALVALQQLHLADHQIALVLTQPDRPAGRGLKLHASPVKQFALAQDIPVAQPRSLRLDGKYPDDAAAARAAIEAAQADAMVVAAYGLILPQWVLELPRLGCLNIHASLLPRWRGAAPIARAIEAGDAETGVCIMRMEAGLDTGPVLARATWPIAPATTAADAHDPLAMLGAKLLVDTLPAYANGKITAQAQSASGVTYAKKLLKDEARLDWSLPATMLARQVCAFNPAPVAWTGLDGKRIRIWRAEPVDIDDTALPGSVLSTNAGGVVVATGRHALRLLELQRPGGRVLPASDAARGWNLCGRRFN